MQPIDNLKKSPLLFDIFKKVRGYLHIKLKQNITYFNAKIQILHNKRNLEYTISLNTYFCCFKVIIFYMYKGIISGFLSKLKSSAYTEYISGHHLIS